MKFSFSSVLLLSAGLLVDAKNLRIINGKEAAPHAYPYMVYIDFSGNGIWHCTGTLISPNYVLTSGGCGYGAYEAVISMGISNIIEPEDTLVKFVSNDITVNPLYINEEYGIRDNVAVVKLPEPVVLSEFIQTVALVDKSDANNDHVNETVTVVSWGPTDYEILSGPLLYMESYIVSNEECVEIYGDDYVYDGAMCMSSESGAPCGGSDSGAPMILDGVQIGVYSFSEQGCYPAYPTGFQRVATTRDWIDENTDL